MKPIAKASKRQQEGSNSRVFTTESPTFYPQRYHVLFEGREGQAGSVCGGRGLGGDKEEAREGEEAARN